MEKIRLTRQEKAVFRHVMEHGGKQPRMVSPMMFHYCLSTLQEKGLVRFKANYEEILSASTTVKGAAYVEQNPKLRNPVDWKGVLLVITSMMTAIATTLALFIGCS